jgi:hypothetical protein
VLSLIDSLLVIEMISFSIYMSIFLSLCMTHSLINPDLTDDYLIALSDYEPVALKFFDIRSIVI